jgi:hypothetical protein
MTKLMQKTDYFWRCLKKRLAGQAIKCPSCNCAASDLLAKKYLVSELRRCRQCKLLFRYPLDSDEENHKFYQRDYSQSFTTDCPTEPELKLLLESEFRGHEKDYSEYIGILRDIGLGPGSAVLDYGCSWGYGTWQLQRAGFRTRAYEISEPRARYARDKLHIEVTMDIADLGKGWDCFFSAHVLEHVLACLRLSILPGKSSAREDTSWRSRPTAPRPIVFNNREPFGMPGEWSTRIS